MLCLHGLGMDEDWFARLLSRLFGLPVRFLIPRATLPGNSWYDYDGDQDRFRKELERTDALFASLLRDVEAQRDLRPRARFLFGFSQGGYCGSVFALRHPELLDGLIVSGARVKTEILETEIGRAGAAGMRALLLHGRRDASVPLEAAQRSRDSLLAGGVAVTLQSFDAGHSVGRAQLAAIEEWLEL